MPVEEQKLLRIASAGFREVGASFPTDGTDRFRSTGQVRDVTWGTRRLGTWVPGANKS